MLKFPSVPFSHVRNDVPAGVVLFLVALPLCLGIALASGAPLFAGIIAGVVGGIVVALFSGSQLSVSGPAAGLASIVLASIAALGDYRLFLVAVVLAGLFQVVIGFLRAGTLGNYIPHSVIKGMLAAIGITIILKQLPHALGYDASGFMDEEMAFGGWEWMRIFTDPFSALEAIHPGAIVIALISLAILLAWDVKSIKKQRWSSLVPAALVAVVVSIALNELFASAAPSLYLSAERGHLVQLPIPASVGAFFSQFTLPNFSGLGVAAVWTTALTIAAVASVESVLSIEAVDKMDPAKRISDVNRELVAQGIGNITSGLLGGLPVTSVIVRSSANVYAGGKTRLSAMVHGGLLLLSVLFIPTLINMLPYACLAAVLLVVGYKLSSLKLIRSMWKEGITQFLPFIVTTVVVVATDILAGVALGILASLYFVIRTNRHAAITVVHENNDWLLRFNKDCSFVNKATLKEHLRTIPDGAHLIVDGTKALYVDHDIYETLHDFEQTATFKSITVQYHNLHDKERVRS